MLVVNYLICIVALAALCFETWLIFKRNRTVRVKGKDDFFTLCLVMLFAMLILRPEDGTNLVEALRGTLVLMAIFFTMAVKRGVSERGIEKLGFTIPWDKIETLQIAPYQVTKLVLLITTAKHTFKLYFSEYQMKTLVFELQKFHPEVLIEESLRKKLSSKK